VKLPLSSYRIAAIRVLFGVLPAALVLALISVSRLPGRLPRGEITQLTSSRAFEGEPSLSPDGQWIAFRCDGQGHTDICVSTADGRDVTNLTAASTDDEAEPAFAPDGVTIAFSGARGGIGLVSRTGGAIRPVTTPGRSPAWTADGAAIVYVREVAPTLDARAGTSEGWKIDLRSGSRTRIASADFREPAISPDGERIAFVGRPLDPISRRQFSHVNSDVWTMPIRGGQPTRVTDSAGGESSPVWSPDSRYLYFTAFRNGVSSIWRVRIRTKNGRTSGYPELLPTPLTQPLQISLSGDGRRLAWSDGRPIERLMRIAFDADARSTRGPAEEIVPGDQEWENFVPAIDLNRRGPSTPPGEVNPQVALPPGTSFPGHWSPNRELFAGSAGGSVWIYRAVTQSYDHFRGGSSPVWLNDSRRLIYVHTGRLYIGEATLKISRELFAMPDRQLASPRLSRDNLHLYFTSSGVDANVWVMSVR
jgi:dipeptidyl aminopeptidase/acylaminoacyl peptidase